MADKARMKSSLASLFIRDGTLVNFIGNLLQIIGHDIGIQKTAIPVLTTQSILCMTPIAVCRSILNLKMFNVVVRSSGQPIFSTQMSSIQFVGNIGAPLDASEETVTVVDEPDDIEGIIEQGFISTRISVRQFTEDPLSIGLFKSYPSNTPEYTYSEK
ncbi:hypothetical protein C8Q75DRAFT_810603 [Abortiporus biennis]|nr:hypothetical protein C8Q75DRAFT_810603 [Abortiporus biennis]